MKHRHALDTRPARGIGAEIARRLAADGAVLTLFGRQRDALQQVAGPSISVSGGEVP